MKKIFLLTIFCSVILTAYSQTNVSGSITSNTTWIKSNSPYIVIGNINVGSGTTLTIEAGVTIKFVIGTSIQINGKLIARGTYKDRITFTSNQLTPTYGDWGNIYFTDNSEDAVTDVNGNYLSGSIIDYSNIEYGGGYSVKGSLQIQKSFPYISNSIIRYGASNGIYAFFQVSGGPLYLMKNTIAFHNNFGIYIDDRAPVVIKGNIIYSNNSGVNFMSAGQFMGNPIVFQNNLLIKNGSLSSSSSVITWTDSYINITNNNFISNNCDYVLYPTAHYQNGSNIKYNTFYSNNSKLLVLFDFPHLFQNNNLLVNNCNYFLSNKYASGSVDATNNWWGTINGSEISKKIFDWNNDNSLELINYNPILNKINIDAPISPPTGLSKNTLGNALIVNWNKNKESDVAGYKLYFGSFDGIKFSDTIDVGIDTTYTFIGKSISDLILVTAYDAQKDNNDDLLEGHESWYSNDVLPDAKILNGDSIKICQGSKVVLHANKSNSYKFQWLKDSVAISGATNDSLEVSTSGNYQVIETNISNVSNTSNTFQVKVHQLIVQNSNISIVCGATLTLQPSITYTGNNNIVYTWEADTTLSATNIKNPIVNTTSSRSYKLSVTDNVCSANASINVSVNSMTVNAGSDKTIICGGTAQLNSVTTNYTGTGTLKYKWTPVTGLNNDSIANPTATVISDITYTVTVTTPNGCTANDDIKVTVNPLTANAGADKTIICGGTVQLNSVTTNYTGTGTLKYKWTPVTGLNNDSIANPTATVINDIAYTVTVTTPNGFTATDVVSVIIIPMVKPEIGMVGVSSNNKNLIAWNKPVLAGIESYYIYREANVTNVYEKIGTVPYDSLSIYVDNQSLPDVQSNKYKLSIYDRHGLESPQSNYHKTMHLAINKGMGNAWNLSWEAYEGFVVSTYNIYRGTTPINLTLLGSTSGSNTQYNDLNAPSGDIYYQLEVISPNSVNPTKVLSSQKTKAEENDLSNSLISYSSSRSNIATNVVSGINELGETKINIYPNPVKNELRIDFEGGSTFEILNLMGQVVSNGNLINKTIMQTSNLSSGVYLIKLKLGNTFEYKKIIKE